jgi:hypothetical protein
MFKAREKRPQSNQNGEEMADDSQDKFDMEQSQGMVFDSDNQVSS